MQLAVWTYEGPPHVGAMRVATAMEGLHYVLHAPQGDTYADLLFTMIERRDRRPPVTYTTFQARDLGGDTAELLKAAALDAVARFRPQALLVGASCTAELIQDDPGGLARTLGLPVPVVPIELPSYQRKENWGAAETLYRLVRAFAHATLTACMEAAPQGQVGLALGAWGAVQASTAGAAVALGGLLRDGIGALARNGTLGEALATPATGYGAVYLIEIVLLFATLVAVGPLVRWARENRSGHPSRLGLAGSPTVT